MKRIFKFLLVIALVVFIKPMVVSADDILISPSSSVANTSGLFRADYTITVNDKMEGSGFVAGNVVTINNEVDGILFTAGNLVNVTTKSDYLFAAGSAVSVSDATFKDGFVAGSEVKLNNVQIARDLYAAGSNITVTGTVGRNLFVSGDNVVIDGAINGDVYVDATTLIINSNSVITGKITYNDDAETTISKDAVIGSKTTYKNPSRDVSIDAKSLTTTVIVNKLLNTLTNLLNILVVGLLMVLLIPRLFEKLSEIEANRLLPSFAWGLLILVAAPVIALIALFTFVGISAGILIGVLYGVLIYLSTIFSTYVITKLIFKKVKNPYLILLIGLPIVYIIKLVPFLGGLLSFALLCLGLGLLTNIIKRK